MAEGEWSDRLCGHGATPSSGAKPGKGLRDALPMAASATISQRSAPVPCSEAAFENLTSESSFAAARSYSYRKGSLYRQLKYNLYLLSFADMETSFDFRPVTLCIGRAVQIWDEGRGAAKAQHLLGLSMVCMDAKQMFTWMGDNRDRPVERSGSQGHQRGRSSAQRTVFLVRLQGGIIRDKIQAQLPKARFDERAIASSESLRGRFTRLQPRLSKPLAISYFSCMSSSPQPAFVFMGIKRERWFSLFSFGLMCSRLGCGQAFGDNLATVVSRNKRRRFVAEGAGKRRADDAPEWPPQPAAPVNARLSSLVVVSHVEFSATHPQHIVCFVDRGGFASGFEMLNIGVLEWGS
ncbi:hypothetical protein BKA70DRAFT_1400746 [Coprinopsis sp. MPI-PUGE-AT-0042]|nr:hypothetical protein BKA70DRAFT_1400746 [Coprinopsis sp. MPI-PUGE-AT-0042]